MLWVTELAYKLKDNARMFFLITIVSTMACVAAGTIVAVDMKNAQKYYDEAFAFRLEPFKDDQGLEDRTIDQALQKEGLSFQKHEMKRFWVTDFEDFGYIPVLSASDFNQIARIVQMKPQELKPNEAVYVYSGSIDEPKKAGDQVRLKKNRLSLTIKETLAKKLISNELLIVNDQTYERLKNQYRDVPIQSLFVYDVPAWSNSDLPDHSSKEAKISQQLYEQNQVKIKQGEEVGWIWARATNYLMLKQSAHMMMFIGFFIAGIFSIFTASFIYFRLFNDLQRDRSFFQSISKIGLSTNEVKRVSTIQIAALFYFPLIVTMVQTSIVLEFVSRYINLKEMLVPSLTVLCTFLLLQTIYFLVVRAQYLKQTASNGVKLIPTTEAPSVVGQ